MPRPRIYEWTDAREQQRQKTLRKKYGITQEIWNAIYDQQEGCCAICGRDDRDLVVDHNHGDGVVRGLLCSNCNTGLGFFGDDPDVVESAWTYLMERGHYPDRN